jgi:glycosyltransferase involved in cell wall biosynthesis
MKKKNIVCIFPGPKYKPAMIDFSGRFEMLSDKYKGEIYSWSTDEACKEIPMGSFLYKGHITKKNTANKFQMALHVIKNAFLYNKKNKVDLIVAYDPLLSGVLGGILKLIFKCKLIVELNSSDLGTAIEMEMGSGLLTKIKVFAANKTRAMVLANVDGIKLLTENQRGILEHKYHAKKVYCFHDFVPTYYFTDAPKKMDPYILFVGYPFYRKGIDLLIEAFTRITDEFPEMELWLIGYRLEEEAKQTVGQWHDRVKFIKPVYYDELRAYFLNCRCFVLPSREEGMGRVLLEAMASGKAIVGANVGGIPGLLENNVNGLLFESENINDLEKKLTLVLSDVALTRTLGGKAVDTIVDKFSAERYIDYFEDMVNGVLDEVKE